MPYEQPKLNANETPEQAAERLSKGLELAPLKGDSPKRSPEEIRTANAEQQAADELAAAKLIEKIKGGEVSKIEVAEGMESDPEGIYGMNLADLRALVLEEPAIFRDDYAGGINSPDWKRKINEKQDAIQASERAEVKLFDRVLNGQANEEEMQIAISKAKKQAETYGLAGFHSAVPKAWYTNERITAAMAETSPENARFIKYVKQHYTNEDLRKQYKQIETDGSVGTYERR